MDSIEAGAHRLDDGTTIHAGGIYPSRLASIFLPPLALSVAPDLPSPDLRHTPPPAASSSSSKRPHADLDGGELSSQKKGRSESPELVPASESNPQTDDAIEDFYQYDGLEYGTIPEALPDEALPANHLPDEALPDEALPDEALPDRLHARPRTSSSAY
ncbi:hypothetical protein EV424DRAFT_1346868 [Suillus variegatus]|nr:hypothetical protein EV424DRAFT_1346868 [Suillus variegatus]